MKKIIAVLLSVLLVLSVSMLFVSADEAESIDVRVTIVDDKSEFAVAYETVTVTDIDGDQTLTINDVLYAAHEQFYEGGAAAGYATETTKWGLSLMKLWGVANGGSYGYLVNNNFAWSMTDPVQADDYVIAYIYTDTKDFSDVYTYFDKQYIENEGQEVQAELTLMKTGFDKEGVPFTEPVAGAKITKDGEDMGMVTDAEGKVSFGVGTANPAGFEAVISAQVDGMVIVPPICILKATGNGEATPDQPDPDDGEVIEPTEETTPAETVAPTDAATKDQSTKDSSTSDSSKTSSATAKTGDVTNMILWIVIAAVCLAGIIGAGVFYKKHYGKK